MIDIHAHILPGLDDGAASTAEALQMAAIAAAEGTGTMVATPHVIRGLYDNTPRQIRAAVARLNNSLAAENIALQILPGAEYRLEPDLPRHLQAGRLLTINDTGRYLLVELPSALMPGYAEQLLYEIQLQGVTPIIAHPERNTELVRCPQRLVSLAQRGILSQVTAGSLGGHFGPAAKRAAQKMLSSGAAQAVASDAHSIDKRPPALAAAAQEIETRWGAALARTVLSTNPRRIIAGQAVEPVVHEQAPGFLARLCRLFSR
ncbi:MAG: tyrosine-protein phosphatase [Dethiobacteria bacterium]